MAEVFQTPAAGIMNQVAGFRSALRRRQGPGRPAAGGREAAGRFVRVIAVVLPSPVLYAGLLIGVPSRWPLAWFSALALCLGAFAALFIKKRRRPFLSLTLFFLGLSIAGVSDMAGLRWLHVAYIPYVLGVGALMSARTLLIAALSVPLFEIPHLLHGGLLEELSVVAVVFATAYVTVVLKRSARAPRQLDGEAAGESSGLAESGLEREQDPELREILRTLAFTLRPGAASLFLVSEGELALRCSTDADLAVSGHGLVQKAAGLRQTVVSNDLGGDRLEAGYRRAGKVSSVAASPVMDGDIVLGVLTLDSPRKGGFGADAATALELFSTQVAGVLKMRRMFAETEKLNEWLSVVHEESSRLVAPLKSRAIIEAASDAMQKIAPLNVHVFLKSGNGYRLMHRSDAELPEEAVFSLRDTLADMALTEKEKKYFRSLAGYPLPPLPYEGGPVQSALMLPLVSEDEPLGAMVLSSEETDSLRPLQIYFLEMLANQATTALKNALLHEEIERRARTDGLTGLFNHRFFKEKLAAEFRRFMRTQRPFSLLLIDIDHFKRVNDTYGHPAGDEVLRGVAATLRKTLRNIDVTARYGGEEFAALLLDTDSHGAVRMAERLRRAIGRINHSTEGGDLKVTVSIGVASCPGDASAEDALIELADRALYRAKAGGRNRTAASRDLKAAP